MAPTVSVWGVVGTGRMAGKFSAAIGETPGHRVGVVVGRTRESAAKFAEQLPGPIRTGDDVALLHDVDLAYVASPNDRHHAHVTALVGLGCPVLCEKPLAASAQAAKCLRDDVVTQSGRVTVAFQYRQHPGHRRARELIQQGVLGRLRFAEVSTGLPELEVPAWYSDLSVSGGGILPMTGIHRVDVLRMITGEDYAQVSAVTEHSRGQAYDDTAAVVARLGCGGSATFQFGLDAPHGDDRIAVHGTAGSLVLEWTMSQWWNPRGGRLIVRSNEGEKVEEFAGVDPYRAQVEDFARFAAGEPVGMATMDDAIAIAEFTEAVYESAATARSVSLTAGQPAR